MTVGIALWNSGDSILVLFLQEKNTKTAFTECPGRVSHREDPGPVVSCRQ